MKSYGVMVSLLSFGGLLLTGCPDLMPTFDATGVYEGTFEVGMGDQSLVGGCDVVIDLEHDVAALPPLNAKVEGTVTLRLDCILPNAMGDFASASPGALAAALGALGAVGLPENLGALLRIAPIPVTGVLLPDGTLELNTPDLLEACSDAGCERLAMLGRAQDVDGDGIMDNYTGTFVGTLVSSLGDIPIAGAFEAYRPIAW